jgi:hypothetical protein
MIKVLRSYTLSVAGVLMLTSLAKIYSSGGSAPLLDLPEAILPMTYRQTLWVVGMIEMAVAFLLLLGSNDRTKLIAIGWLGANFALYRAAVKLLTVGSPCPCLGSITQMLPLSKRTIQGILTGVMVYLICGSVLFWVLRSRAGKRSELDIAPGDVREVS